MKKIIILIFIAFIHIGLYAQNFHFVTSHEYDSLKLNNSLTGNEVILSDGMVNPEDVKGGKIYVQSFPHEKATGCSGYFNPPGPSLPVTSLDDGWLSANPLTLPFTFCFFGDNYNTVWMNNNGNISFGGGISAFTSTAFPSSGNKMIGGFWADVDLNGGGTMHATITPSAAIFNWVSVGYFSAQSDKLNTFQIVITDGNDPLVIGGNLALHYADMQWTTGSASQGTNGFGGTPATVGANRGNGTDYFLVGRFDHAGTDYDGPYGINDGVSYLDNKSFFFDVCSAGANIPPVPLQTDYCDTVWVCNIGDTLEITFPFISPEVNQTTTVTYSAPTLSNVVTVNNTTANTGVLTLQIIGAQQTVGVHDLIVTGTDNYSTPGVTAVTYKIGIKDYDTVFSTIPELIYSGQCAPVTFHVGPENYDSYEWEFNGSTDDSLVVDQGYNDTLSVIVEKYGCKYTVDSLVHVYPQPSFGLTGSTFYCGPNSNVYVQLADSASLSSINWVDTTNPTVSIGNQYSIYLQEGSYGISIVGPGSCTNDTVINIQEVQVPVIFDDTLFCGSSFQVVGTQSANGGVWSSANSNLHFSNTAVENPIITVDNNGTYLVTYTDNVCNLSVSATVIFPESPVIFNDTAVCGLSYQVEGATSYLNAGHWSSSPATLTFTASADSINPLIVSPASGFYQLTYTDSVCNHTATSKITFYAFPTIDVGDLGCDLQYFVNNTIAYNGGVWYSQDTALHFSDSSVLNPHIDVSHTGTYEIYFVDNQCQDTLEASIYFPPYTYTQTMDSVMCLGTIYTIYAQENNTYTDMSWSNGETGVAQISISQPGNYIVTVSNECYSYSDTATIGGIACDIQVPNVLSLSSTVGNNLWVIDYAGVESMECTIVNRWGDVIYEYNDPAGSWNGRTKGGDVVAEGTYFYIIKAKLYGNDNEIVKHGFIEVIH